MKLPKQELTKIFAEYYGEKYQLKINKKLNNLLTCLIDSLTTKDQLQKIKSHLTIKEYSFRYFENEKNLSNYNEVFWNVLDKFIKDLELNFGIEKEYVMANIKVFLDDFFNPGDIDKFLNMQKFSSTIVKNNNPMDLPSIKKLILRFHLKMEDLEFISFLRTIYQNLLYRYLFQTDYYRNMVDSLNASEDILHTIFREMAANCPFSTHYVDLDNKWKDFLYFPLINVWNCGSNVNVVLLHEIIHVLEGSSSHVGLFDGYKGRFVNEVRTDLLAMQVNEGLNKPLLMKDNRDYRSFYLTLADPILPFFYENSRVFSHYIMEHKNDVFPFIFGRMWEPFLEETDRLYTETDYLSNNIGGNRSISCDYSKVMQMIKIMNEHKEKVLKK